MHAQRRHFEIAGYAAGPGGGGNATITFGKGGFQGARGGRGSDWYISNVFEELDAPTEFYYGAYYSFHCKERAEPQGEAVKEKDTAGRGRWRLSVWGNLLPAGPPAPTVSC
eukprot:SAG22_NODE_237_length_14221_cov_37.207832_13_plen_111_part_00